jgi:hypothetical protein
MNLLQFFNEKLSHDGNVAYPPKHFSEQVTMYNVLNGTFPDDDILNVKISDEGDKPKFDVTLRTEAIAENAEQNLDKMIVPGAYKPLYELNVSRQRNVLTFDMNEV